MKYIVGLILFTGVSWLGLVSPPDANAQSCGSYRTYRASYPTYSYPTYSAPVTYSAPYTSSYTAPYVAPVVKKVVEHKDDYYLLKFVAVAPLVELPTYSAVYVPPYSPLQHPNPASNQNQNKDDMKQVLELLKGYETRFKAIEDKLKGTVAPVTPTPDGKTSEPKIPDVKEVNSKKCAVCHQRGNEASGGKFVLSEADGSIVRLNNEQLGELDEQLSTNAMPKLNVKSKQAGITQLSDVEYAAWRQEISRQRALNKKKD